MGLDAVSIPLFKVEPVAWDPPEPSGFDGLLLTSANAVRHAGDKLTDLRGLPVYAVGEATSQAARDAGFDIKATGDAGADRLLGSIETGLKLLHLCGKDRRAPENPSQQITALPVYRAVSVDVPELGDLNGGVAMIHSPMAGERFAKLVDDRSGVTIAAISAAAADAAGSGWRKVEVASSPTDDALLALAARLCNKSQPK
jgi:uroporphyrinogen-III synthase